jgi:hypothetical protein
MAINEMRVPTGWLGTPENIVSLAISAKRSMAQELHKQVKNNRGECQKEQQEYAREDEYPQLGRPGQHQLLSFHYLLLDREGLLLIFQTLLLALDECLQQFRMFFLQVTNLLQ